MPPLDEANLWPVQAEATRNLEQSLAEARPRSLVQMATGNGKMFMGRIQLGPMSLNPDLCSASVV